MDEVPVQGQAAIAMFTTTLIYTCQLEDGALADQLKLQVKDQWDRLFDVYVRINLRCDVNEEVPPCGTVTMEPKLELGITTFGQSALGVFPWQGAGINVEGVPAASYVVPAGRVVFNWMFFLTGIMEGDGIVWEYSQDGVTYQAFNLGPAPLHSTDMANETRYIGWASDVDEALVPQQATDMWIRATVSRVYNAAGNVLSWTLEKKIEVVGTNVSAGGAEADSWTVWIDDEEQQTYSEAGLIPGAVVGSNAYTSCIACGDEAEFEGEEKLDCYTDEVKKILAIV